MDTETTRECPGIDVLEAVASGRDEDPAARRHIEECDRCRSTVEAILEDNTFLGRVVDAVGSEDAHEGPPDDIAGYDVGPEIHRGGQGAIYRAFQTSTRRDVALKMLLRGTFATVRQRRRFEREIEVVAAMRHPNIVTVYDSGRTPDGRHYYAMEYIDGVPLDEFVARDQLSVEDTLDLFERVCDAVSYAHQRGVIHRDLKPANILVDGEGQPRVLDFGLAKEMAPQGMTAATQEGEFLGTLAYAAPEQVSGDPDAIDTRTDVYALGVILYGMLTARRPYDLGSSLVDAIQCITRVEPGPPGRHRPEIDDEVDTIVLKSLAKDKERRYQSAAEFLADVRRYRMDQPILAKGDSGWYLLRKAVRRYRAQVTVLAVILVMIIAFAISMSVLYGQKVEAEREARNEADLNGRIAAFLETVLVGGEEGKSWNDQVTIYRVLEYAESQLQSQFSDDAAIAARLRRTLGKVYFALREPDDAARHLELALEQAREIEGADDPVTLDIMRTLIAVRDAQGRHADSAELAEEARRRWVAIEGEVSAEVAEALEWLGRALWKQRKDAEPTLREALRVSLLVHGTDGLETASPRVTLANVIKRDQEEEAERLYREALAVHRAHPDRRKADGATARIALAAFLHQHRRLDEGAPLYREAVDLYRDLLDPQDPNLAVALLGLASACVELEQAEEAERLYLEALAIYESRPDEIDPNAWLAYWRLGRLDIELERYTDADERYGTAIDQLSAQSPGNPAIAQMQREYGIALREQARYEEAERALFEALNTYEALSPKAAKSVVTHLVKLYEAWGRPEDAARWRERE